LAESGVDFVQSRGMNAVRQAAMLVERWYHLANRIGCKREN
jgi:hypothetical protein